MAATRRKYSQEFKVEAVRMITEKGLLVTQVGRDLGIDRTLLTKWKHEVIADPREAFPGKGRLKTVDEELHRLARRSKH